MINPLMVSSKNVKVSQKRCLGTSIESFIGSFPSEQIIIVAVRQFRGFLCAVARLAINIKVVLGVKKQMI